MGLANMSEKVFVGNISYEVDEAELMRTFQKFGPTECTIIIDKVTQKSKGYAFMTLGSAEEAEKAKTEMTGFELHGRALAVNDAVRNKNGTGGQQGGMQRSYGGQQRQQQFGYGYGQQQGWIWTARWLRRLPTAGTIWLWTTTRLWPTTARIWSRSPTAGRPDRTRWSVGKLLNHSSCDVIIPKCDVTSS